MFTVRHNKMTVGWDVIWWLAVLTLAGMLTMLLSTRLANAAPPVSAQPGLMPELRQPWADGVAAFRAGDMLEARDAFADAHCYWIDAHGSDARDPALQLWTTLADQTAGDWEMAVTGWQQAVLPAETDVHRYLALTLLYLEHEQVDLAGEMLDRAWQLAPSHPLVHYANGIYNLQVADQLIDWPDGVGPRMVRFAAWKQPMITPNTRAVARMIAAMEFERAIERAIEIDPHQPMLPFGWTAEPQLVPTVADVMAATGTTQFVSQAHVTLGGLFIERGLTESAEEHLDAAADVGVRIPWAYSDVARLYEQQGRHFEAARAQAKQLRYGVKDLRATMGLMEYLGRAVGEALFQ